MEFGVGSLELQFSDKACDFRFMDSGGRIMGGEKVCPSFSRGKELAHHGDEAMSGTFLKESAKKAVDSGGWIITDTLYYIYQAKSQGVKNLFVITPTKEYHNLTELI